MTKNIIIKWDKQDSENEGWSYSHRDESGEVNGQAADAVDRILENMEPKDGDHEALRAAIGYAIGDTVSISPGEATAVRLGTLLDH